MSKSNNGELTILQKKFCEILFSMKTPNQGRAYELAGYKCKGKTAHEAASRLAKNVKVKKYLKKLQDAVTKKTLINAKKVVERFSDLAERSKIANDRTNENRALENLGKHFNIYDKHEEAGATKTLMIVNFNDCTKQIISEQAG